MFQYTGVIKREAINVSILVSTDFPDAFFSGICFLSWYRFSMNQHQAKALTHDINCAFGGHMASKKVS